MRVTQGMIINNSLNGLYSNMNNINKLYGQMTTGKKIQTVSDDPIIAGRALKLKSTVLETNQYESNVKEANSWMEITEGALTNITEILKEIRTKCVQGANGSLEEKDKNAIKTDISQLMDQILQEANTTYGGRYVFSGYKTNEPLVLTEDMTLDSPLEIKKDMTMPGGGVITAGTIMPAGSVFPAGSFNPAVYGKIDGQNISYEVGTNNTIDVNTLGMDSILDGIKSSLEEMISMVDESQGDNPKYTNEELCQMFDNKLEELDESLANVSEKTADLGSKMKRTEYVETRLADQKTSFKSLLSETEDIDIEETYVQFNMQYATYQSALQATSKVITNTLADYL